MRYGLIGCVILACSIPAPAFAKIDTQMMACYVHPGDDPRPIEVTQIVRLTVPYPDNQMSGMTVMRVGDAFGQVVRKTGRHVYKTHCSPLKSVDEGPKMLANWEWMSGYGTREKVEIPHDEIWPAVFDQLYRSHTREPSVNRSMYRAEVLGSLVSSDDNEAITKAKEEHRANQERAKRKPEELVIGFPSSTANPKPLEKTEADRRFEENMKRYRESVAAHESALDAYQEGLSDLATANAGNADNAAKASAQYAAELARADAAQAEYQRQRQAYREEYKRVTGRYPDE